MQHQTVLLTETVESLRPRPGGIYVDGTLGGGGHTALLLQRSNPDGTVIGIDQDSFALTKAAKRLAQFQQMGRLQLVHANFSLLAAIIAGFGYSAVDGILFDLGFSSFQMDSPERGFSYRVDAPLDMRMDPNTPTSAADLANTAPEEELLRIISEYGEERWAARIARKIVQRRQETVITTTGQLTQIILDAYPTKNRDGTHPARRTFQALRIAVNRELEILADVLQQAVNVLSPGGWVAVISFHSLEDRIVKQFFKQEASQCICPPGLPICQCDHKQSLKIITRKPVLPTAEEVRANPRARSAKLRVAEKLA